jgi:acyl-CoA synthetase (AMP-forming)/AMP-acid ligase II
VVTRRRRVQNSWARKRWCDHPVLGLAALSSIASHLADVIKTGGHKVSALEIERVLLEHPFVAEVAVLGIPDDKWGQAVGAIIRVKTGAPTTAVDDVTTFCGDATVFSAEKRPRKLLFVDAIPKNAMGAHRVTAWFIVDPLRYSIAFSLSCLAAGKVNKKQLVPMFAS